MRRYSAGDIHHGVPAALPVAVCRCVLPGCMWNGAGQPTCGAMTRRRRVQYTTYPNTRAALRRCYYRRALCQTRSGRRPQGLPGPLPPAQGRCPRPAAAIVKVTNIAPCYCLPSLLTWPPSCSPNESQECRAALGYVESVWELEEAGYRVERARLSLIDILRLARGGTCKGQPCPCVCGRISSTYVHAPRRARATPRLRHAAHAPSRACATQRTCESARSNSCRLRSPSAGTRSAMIGRTSAHAAQYADDRAAHDATSSTASQINWAIRAQSS